MARDTVCAIEAETGVVWCWGFAMHPAVGPVPLRGIRHAVAIELSENDGCAATDDGSVWCWGYRADGDEALDALGGPGPVPTRLRVDDAIGVSLGGERGCVVRRNGHVACWPVESGTTNRWRNAPEPADVLGVDDTVDLAVGGWMTCARVRDGHVRCWREPSGTPRDVGAPSSRDLSGAGGPICGVSTQGQAWCLDDEATVHVVPELHGMTQTTSNGRSVCGAREDGSVDCYTRTPRYDPLEPTEAMREVVHVGHGREQSCGLLRDGRIACVGADRFGGVGNPLGDMRLTPALVDGLDDVVQLEAANNDAARTTCARRANGEVRCWGGQPGLCGRSDGASCPRPTRMAIPPAIDVAVGTTMACAVHPTGTVTCWGDDDEGVDSPATIRGIDEAIDVAATSDACVVLRDGAVTCFTSNEGGHTPRRVHGLPAMRSVRAVGAHGFAGIARDATSWTWDTDLVNGSIGFVQRMPEFVASTWNDAHVCVVDENGQLRCSNGTLPARAIAARARAFCATNERGCVLLEDGAVDCWNETRGTIGAPMDEFTLRRAPMSAQATSLVCGDAHACALLVDGHVACWGRRGSGELGDGTVSIYETPYVVTRPAP